MRYLGDIEENFWLKVKFAHEEEGKELPMQIFCKID